MAAERRATCPRTRRKDRTNNSGGAGREGDRKRVTRRHDQRTGVLGRRRWALWKKDGASERREAGQSRAGGEGTTWLALMAGQGGGPRGGRARGRASPITRSNWSKRRLSSGEKGSLARGRLAGECWQRAVWAAGFPPPRGPGLPRVPPFALQQLYPTSGSRRKGPLTVSGGKAVTEHV